MSIYELVAWDQKTIEIYEQTKKHTNRPKSIHKSGANKNLPPMLHPFKWILPQISSF